MATEIESNLYKQSATYKHFVVMHNLRALASWAVNEKAYKHIMNAIDELNSLESLDFGEDNDGKLKRELLPTSQPKWRK